VSEELRQAILAILGRQEGWATIDELVACLDRDNRWPQEWLTMVSARAKKDEVRHLIRRCKDENGWPTVASVITQTPEGKVRVYKQETLFTLDDYRQAVAYHHGRAKHFTKMRDGYRKRCYERLHVQLEIPYPQVQK
jgi:hypothetical protein